MHPRVISLYGSSATDMDLFLLFVWRLDVPSGNAETLDQKINRKIKPSNHRTLAVHKPIKTVKCTMLAQQ